MQLPGHDEYNMERVIREISDAGAMLLLAMREMERPIPSEELFNDMKGALGLNDGQILALAAWLVSKSLLTRTDRGYELTAIAEGILPSNDKRHAARYN